MTDYISCPSPCRQEDTSVNVPTLPLQHILCKTRYNSLGCCRGATRVQRNNCFLRVQHWTIWGACRMHRF